MVDRRSFIKAAGVGGTLGITGLSGCIGSFGSQPYGDGTVNFMMSPSEPQDYMMSQYRPYAKYLEEQLDDASVDLKYAADYSAVLQGLGSGTADLAETGPFAAALGVNADKCAIALQRKGYGSWDYASVLATREDSDIESLSDLEGERVAFADRLSASGALFPLYMLKQAGLNIGDLPSDKSGADFTPQFSSHAQAFSALEAGQVAAAGVGKFITLNDARELKDGFRYVETEDGIPRAPIVVSPTLSDEAKQSVTDALTGAPDSMYFGADGEEGTDDDLWFSKVREASVEDYQPVIDVAVDLGIKTELLDQSGD